MTGPCMRTRQPGGTRISTPPNATVTSSLASGARAASTRSSWTPPNIAATFPPRKRRERLVILRPDSNALTSTSSSAYPAANAGRLEAWAQAPLAVLATPGHLEQVLDNLIANALEASPPGGTITIEGDKADYDLLVLVPPHAGQEVVAASGLGDAGAWVPTDRATLAHRDHQQIFALGDATDLPISKSGSTAHFEAPVVASRIASLLRGTAPKANYGGRVMCFLETGDGRATALRFDYQHPPVPPAPSRFWHAAKWAFNRLYWDTVPQGRIPERRAATHDSQRRPA